MKKRRAFLRDVVKSSIGVAIGSRSISFTAKSYNQIIGANERIQIAIIGLNGRGASMARTFAKQPDLEITAICDVDSRTIPKVIQIISEAGQTRLPKGTDDCRKVLEEKQLDAIYIATPDHWHAPLLIMGCQAGKHVYVEKPLSHNPQEGEWAVEAAKKYNRIVQMGAQRRSEPLAIQCVKELHAGVIGRVYMAKTWYTNNRKPTFLKPATVPEWLNYDLWQGPAPRKAYMDGLIHYNWHWFWDWGTGEALNNGTHEVDLARWGLNVDYPIRVSSIGGRFQYADDWQTPDTQVITMDYPGKISLIWESRSRNGRKIEETDRGVIFYGEGGSIDTDGESYRIYDINGVLNREIKKQTLPNEAKMQGRNTASPSLSMDSNHVANFLDCIRNNKVPNCDVESGFKSVLAMQLGNISWRVGRDLQIDSQTGYILNDPEALKYWQRSYHAGWEPKV